MFRLFLSLEWKAFFRSASFGKSLGLKILLIFLALYFASAFLIFGIGLYPILKENLPTEEPLQVVNKFVLAWFVLELGLRFLLQTLPVMDIKPLLNQPVPKRKVVNFVLVKSLYSFFNFLPLFIIIPFGIFNIYKTQLSTLGIAGWMLAMIFLTLCVNFINFIIKKRFTDNLKALFPAMIFAGFLALLDYLKIFEISYWFGKALDMTIDFPYLAFVPLFLLFLLFKWNQLNLEKKFYLDTQLKGRVKATNTRDFNWTRKFGEIAPFLQQDLKLIWRNKRPRTTIYLSLLLLGYGLIFYPAESYQDMPSLFVFVGVFMTGVFMINFGQFIPSWDASYYPMIMAQNIPLKQYLASKAALMAFSVIFLAILTTPYIYFGRDILMINMVCALYNIGVNIPILLYAGSFNKKRIDLDKSPFMNYQGTGAAQWLVSLPLMALPVLLFWLIQKIINFETALISLAGLGIIGLLLRNNLLKFLAEVYKKKKYVMIQGFQQTGE